MHSINLFSDAYIRQVEATFAYKPKSHDEFSQPTHRRRRPAFILQPHSSLFFLWPTNASLSEESAVCVGCAV
jgi:hypothetical protein